MKIDLENASKKLYPRPSFDLVYQEAVANAIDAGATNISISISIARFDKPESLSLIIKDNGCGFTDYNFNKFSNLLSTDRADHKGMGRLVYLRYFEKIRVESIYGGSMYRTFNFDRAFDGKSDREHLEIKKDNGTTLSFSGFLGQKFHKYDYLRPQDIKRCLIEVFFPFFLQLKQERKELSINIRLDTEQDDPVNHFYSREETLEIGGLPEYEKIDIKRQEIDFLSSISLYYRIEKNDRASKNHSSGKKATVMICSDNRAINFPKLLKNDQVPDGYIINMFIDSDLFKGRTNLSRQKLELPDNLSDDKIVQIIKPEIRKIFNSKFPFLLDQNKKTEKKIQLKFPHLSGCFSLEESIGIAIEDQLVEVAQKNFFAKQKEILGYTGQLNNENFNAALEYVSRSLTEYILHRDIVIKALKEKDKTKREKDLHDILAPQRSIVRSESKEEAYYTTNLWLLDDKFMSFEIMLSEATMETILEEIEETDDEYSKARPDIAIYFSQKPDGGDAPKSVETVIIELKKYGIHRYRSQDVISQLKDRARILCKHFPHKISRMWYYGIVEINPKLEKYLKEADYYQIFSTGKAYAKSEKLLLEDENGREVYKYVDVCIMNYETVLSDAEVRNNTLLDFLRKNMKQFLKKTEGNANFAD